MDDKEKPVPCMNQIFKPKVLAWRKDGQGDCSICKSDEKNKECTGYSPVQITIHKFEVK